MAKAGMRRPDPKDPHGTESNRKTHFPKNEVAPVPEIQGKAKTTKEKAKPITEKQAKRAGQTPCSFHLFRNRSFYLCSFFRFGSTYGHIYPVY